MYAYLATQFLAAMAGIGGATALYEAEVSHNGRALTVRYHGTPDVTFRQVGQWLPNRPGSAVCRWTARLAVRRDVVGAEGPIAAFARPVPVGATISGSRPGRCMTARKTIAREAAARLGGREQLAAIASGDRATLVAELDSAR